jgi:hypothetical protein
MSRTQDAIAVELFDEDCVFLKVMMIARATLTVPSGS